MQRSYYYEKADYEVNQPFQMRAFVRAIDCKLYVLLPRTNISSGIRSSTQSVLDEQKTICSIYDYDYEYYENELYMRQCQSLIGNRIFFQMFH